MCGIAGAVGGPADRARLVRAIAAQLTHRGPDDVGEFSDGACSLAMRRLSIIDLLGGHQPLFNETRQVAGICNGELYNFQSLRRELELRGHTFATGSDAEVAVHGYEQWGDGFVSRINGMFALALWDGARCRLLLARDRVGKKPLYYATLEDGGLVFGSELRSLLAIPGRAWTVDREACRAFCGLGYLPADRTPLVEIRRLPPGHVGVWEAGRFETRRYWTVETAPPPDSEAAAAERLLALLQDAVALRLISDVPVGAFVSGGLDSSLVVAIAAGLLGARIPTFNVAFPGYGGFDEARHARRLARHFGCDHHEIPVDWSHFADPAALVWSLDEPLADPAALPTLLLSREARKHVTVALTGEGADEVFGGYQRYRMALSGSALARRFGGLRYLAAGGLALRPRRALDDSPVSRLLRSARDGGADPLAWSRVAAMAPAAARAAGWPSDGFPTRGPRARGPAAAGSLLALQVDDVENLLANGLLTKVDRMTMAASLEARCPFLDYRVVAFGLGLPDRWKIRGRTGKVILREVARRLLPREILNRPKHTFRVPLRRWLRGPLRDLARDAVSSACLRRFGVLPADEARILAEDHIAGRADYSRALWSLVTLHLWLTEAERRAALQAP